MKVPSASIPPWVHRAERRRQLLSIGVSLTEQDTYPTWELDTLLAVVETGREAQREAEKRESRRSTARKKNPGRR